MAKYQLTATHGVHLWDLDVQFEMDATSKNVALYRYETDDALLVAALLKVEGYGISADEDAVKAADAAEKKAAKEAAEREAAAAKAAADADQK